MEEVTIPITESGDLIKYTESHFMNRLQEDLENIREPSLRIQKWVENDSNSPISMSSDSDNDDCFEYGELKSDIQPSFKKLTFREVQASIDKYYETDQRFSNELDILSTYLKGQEQVLLKASDITVIKIYIVLGPAIIASVALSVLLLMDSFRAYYLCGLNVFVFVLYFMNIWFEWNSSYVCYRLYATQYDRFSRSFDNCIVDTELGKQDQVMDTLRNIEEKIREWKETAVFVLPWECKRAFPILCHIHLFTFIKRIETYKKNLIMKFKDIKNEIRYIQWKWGENSTPKEHARFHFLCHIKEKIKGEILHYRNAYGCMQDLLTKEIQRANRWDWFLLSKRNPMVTENPVVVSYFSTIFEDD
jgi:hypothetical protein